MLWGAPRGVRSELARARIDDVLDRAAPLTIVSGPRGVGKTVAVAAWARRPDLLGAWIPVDARTTAPTPFWTRLFGFVEDSTRASGDPVAAPSRVHEDARRTIVGWITSVPRSTVIVIDGADTLAPEVLDDLVWASTLSPRVRIVLVGRRLSVPGATLIDADAVAFDSEEIAALLAAAGARPTAEIVGLLRSESAGSPAVIAAVALDIETGGVTLDGEAPVVLERIRAIAARVLLDRPERTAATDDLLARIALLSTTSVPEAVRLTGAPRTDVETALDEAAAAGLGQWGPAGSGRRFSFAPAVARALTGTVRRAPEAEVLRVAARIRADRGESFEAVSLAIDARDFRFAVVAGAPALTELITERWEPLLAQLSAIPRSELTGEPLVVLFLAILHAQRSRGRVAMVAHYATAELLVRSNGPRGHRAERAVLLIGRSIALRLLGRDRLAAASARSALAALDSAPRPEVEAIGELRPLVLGQAALALFLGGDVPEAREVAVRAATVDGARTQSRQHTWSKSAYIEAVWGDIAAAEDRLDAADRLEPWPDYFFRVPPGLAGAMIAVEKTDLARARSILDDLGPRVHTTEFWPAAAAVRVALDLTAGRPGNAIDDLRRALRDREAAALASSSRRVLGAILAIAHVADGDPVAARHALKSAPGGLEPTSVPAVLLRLVVGDPDDVVALANDGLRAARSSPRTVTALTLLRAAASARRGSEAAASRDIAAATRGMLASGLRTPWWLIPERDRAVLDRLAREVLGAESTLPAELSRMPVVVSSRPTREALTPRETLVLEHLASGRSNDEIAQAIGVSVNTVRKQRASAYRKLGASSRAEAVSGALERGVFDRER